MEELGVETSLWEFALHGSAVYLSLVVVLRLAPERHPGSLFPGKPAKIGWVMGQG